MPVANFELKIIFLQPYWLCANKPDSNILLYVSNDPSALNLIFSMITGSESFFFLCGVRGWGREGAR